MEKEEFFNNAQMSQPNKDPTALQIRLDTRPIIESIEIFLRGETTIFIKNDSGVVTQQKVKQGEPKMNDNGIRSLLNWIGGVINSQVVQGNFPSDPGAANKGHSTAYESYICEFQKNLGKHIVTNRVDWDLPDTETEGLIDFIMSMIIPFMSRLIDNLERGSYSDTIKHTETGSNVSRGGRMQMFKT